ncbi:L-lactate permease, partial [Streptococcus danieliae]|nr:L-lactate permease [Streptococcus danieliae]
DGFKGVKEVLPAILVSGGSFAATQLIILNTMGAELMDVASAIVSIISLVILLKFWKPKNVLKDDTKTEVSTNNLTGKQILKAWSPFKFLTIFVVF